MNQLEAIHTEKNRFEAANLIAGLPTGKIVEFSLGSGSVSEEELAGTIPIVGPRSRNGPCRYTPGELV